MKKNSSKSKVAIIMGSQTDLTFMKDAIEILNKLDIPCKVEIISAHRTPEKMVTFAKKAQIQGVQIIIAGAGGAAHLPGMVASLTSLPVIGVPIEIGPLQGLDALLSIVQMPKGIPVATVAINNSYNAGLLAARILSLSDTKIQKKLEDFREEQEDKVKEMNKNLLMEIKL